MYPTGYTRGYGDDVEQIGIRQLRAEVAAQVRRAGDGERTFFPLALHVTVRGVDAVFDGGLRRFVCFLGAFACGRDRGLRGLTLDLILAAGVVSAIVGVPQAIGGITPLVLLQCLGLAVLLPVIPFACRQPPFPTRGPRLLLNELATTIGLGARIRHGL